MIGRKPKNFPQFTHFASIPFIQQKQRNLLGKFQDKIQQIFKDRNLQNTLQRSSTNLMHITLSMLTLNLQQYRQKVKAVIARLNSEIKLILCDCIMSLGDIKYFTRFNNKSKQNQVTLFYFDFVHDEYYDKIEKVTDLLIRQFVKEEIINPNELKQMHLRYDHKTGKYKNDQYHMTLFRINNLRHNENFQQIFKEIQDWKKEYNGQIIKLKCEYLDISTRFHYDKSNFYEPFCRVELNQKEQKLI